MIKIPYKNLRDFGSPTDIESPLGFLRLSLPFPQNDPDYLRIYAPCVLSVLERYKYGPELMAAYSWNIYPEKDVKELYTVAKNKVYNLPQKMLSIINAKINELKSRYAPYYSLSTSQHFYEEGRRFYFHPKAKTMFIASASPGIMIPEEYYGEEIYFPGITKVIPPGDLWKTEGISFEYWKFRIRELIFSGRRIENPFRTIYFDESINKSTLLLNYGIFWKEARNTIKRKIDKWKKIGLLEEYIEDFISITHFFFSRANMEIVKLNSVDGKFSYLYTLISEGYWFVSERDVKMKKIRKGRVFNVPLIINTISALGGSATNITLSFLKIFDLMESKMLNIPISAISGYITKTALLHFFKQRIKNVEDEFNQGINLKEYIKKNYGPISEYNLRKWVDREIISEIL